MLPRRALAFTSNNATYTSLIKRDRAAQRHVLTPFEIRTLAFLTTSITDNMGPKPTLDLSGLKLGQELENLARSAPGSIDSILVPYILSPSLPKDLLDLILAEITTRVTPELHWGGNPTRKYYPSCCLHATLLGRAFALLYDIDSTSDAIAQALGAQRAAIWNSMCDIFVKGLFSGPEPEPGARFAAGVLILASGRTISRVPGLRGKGKDWVWYDNEMDGEAEWDWEELRQAVMDTESLPRGNTDPTRLKGVHPVPEYVPQEVLDVLDAARLHLAEGKADMSSEELRTEVFHRLF